MLRLLKDLTKKKELQRVLQKALQFGITFEDVSEGDLEIMTIFESLGNCKVEEDKLPVLNFLIFIAHYSGYAPLRLWLMEDHKE